MAPGLVKLPDAAGYRETLKSLYVLPDMEERRAVIRERVEQLAADMNGKVLPDEELLEIVTNLVEFPVPVVGKFDEKFLELPQEILITAMREHQKYFAVVREDGRLMPFFIAVNNTEARDMGLVAKGHERVGFYIVFRGMRLTMHEQGVEPVLDLTLAFVTGHRE